MNGCQTSFFYPHTIQAVDRLHNLPFASSWPMIQHQGGVDISGFTFAPHGPFTLTSHNPLDHFTHGNLTLRVNISQTLDYIHTLQTDCDTDHNPGIASPPDFACLGRVRHMTPANVHRVAEDADALRVMTDWARHNCQVV